MRVRETYGGAGSRWNAGLVGAPPYVGGEKVRIAICVGSHKQQCLLSFHGADILKEFRKCWAFLMLSALTNAILIITSGCFGVANLFNSRKNLRVEVGV